MRISILGISFVLPRDASLTKEEIYARYGDKEVAKSETHFNKSKANCDLIYKKLREEDKKRKEADKLKESQAKKAESADKDNRAKKSQKFKRLGKKSK